MMTPVSFADGMAKLSLPSVFNPYCDNCAIHDRSDAASVRRRNIVLFLDAALAARVDTLWVARDLGHRGGRRTGIPLTDEVHLDHASSLMGGQALHRATLGPLLAERTAAVVWRALCRIGNPVVLWNVFPFHPHEPGAPFSNRCHSRAERHILLSLIEMIRPKRLVAIGRDAASALSCLGLPLHAVRHPSYGGQAEFEAGIHAIYGVAGDRDATTELPFDESGATIRPAAA